MNNTRKASKKKERNKIEKTSLNSIVSINIYCIFFQIICYVAEFRRAQKKKNQLNGEKNRRKKKWIIVYWQWNSTCPCLSLRALILFVVSKSKFPISFHFFFSFHFISYLPLFASFSSFFFLHIFSFAIDKVYSKNSFWDKILFEIVCELCNWIRFSIKTHIRAYYSNVNGGKIKLRENTMWEQSEREGERERSLNLKGNK